ncbi:MAG: pyruvate kinase, partial [Chloroflexota bacterium]
MIGQRSSFMIHREGKAAMPEINIRARSVCELLEEISTLRAEIEHEGVAIYERFKPYVSGEDYRASALNLAHYLVLRQHDLRDLQLELVHLGFASLGRIESNVLGALTAIENTLKTLCEGAPHSYPDPDEAFVGLNTLRKQAISVLGHAPEDRTVRIMVTLAKEAAEDPAYVANLMDLGMNCARINCAHYNAEIWRAMITNVKQAASQRSIECPIYMDIAGPKIRTQSISFGRKHLFRAGDTLLLTRGEPIASDVYPYQVSCAEPEVLKQPEVGQSVWFDDGKIGTRIEEIIPEGLVLRIEKTSPEGTRVRIRKGINFPDTRLEISPLTPKDLQDLNFIAQHADMVGYSFVQTGEDIALLQSELEKRLNSARRLEDIAIVAKIETKKAVTNLPDLIIRGAGRQPFGVMVARGDLAVEIGFERLAEMQEEIIWICEAAHVPVIWATQVLEGITKRGVPSRAEISDAAHGIHAECVMLNKGDYVADALTVLNDVLVRM